MSLDWFVVFAFAASPPMRFGITEACYSSSQQIEVRQRWHTSPIRDPRIASLLATTAELSDMRLSKSHSVGRLLSSRVMKTDRSQAVFPSYALNCFGFFQAIISSSFRFQLGSSQAAEVSMSRWQITWRNKEKQVMENLQQTHFEYLVIGSGLRQSILAAWVQSYGTAVPMDYCLPYFIHYLTL